MVVALLLSGVIFAVAVFTFYRSLQVQTKIHSEEFLPPDELRFYRAQVRRRMLNSFLLTMLAALIAGSYLSGVEAQATELGSRNDHLAEGEPRIEPSPEDKQFFRVYVAIWATILLLTMIVVSLAILDFWATRRYAWQQLMRIREDHRTLLERDLAMARQQRNDRRRFRTVHSSDDPENAPDEDPT